MRYTRQPNNIIPKERTAMTYGRWIVMAVVALLIVTVAGPRYASAASLVPFRATVSEHFTAGPCSPVPSFCVTANGTGNATHLGRIRESATIITDLASNPAPGCVTETRTTTLTAANGDQITLEAMGKGCRSTPTTLTAVDYYVVTGGTGRFSGASGHGTIMATINLASGTAVVTFDGVLSSPGSIR